VTTETAVASRTRPVCRNVRAFSVPLLALVLALSPRSSAQEGSPSSIVRAARSQIGKTVRYAPAYQVLAYPNGDVPIETGVCTDVVVRALRASLGMDLQQLVHEDMARHFSRYPRNWGLKRPDKNIDHRRVPNLQVFFQRQGWEVGVSQKAEDYNAGDLVTCIVPPNLPHIMIVTDRTNAAGCPFIIHNIGAGAQEEDRLFESKLTGHYRVSKIESAAPGNQRPSSPGT
jgi:uncharacterized protein